MDIQIQPLSQAQTAEARHLILSVAYNIYQWAEPFEEITRQFDKCGKLRDVDDLQSEYLDRQGIFLAALDQERLIGTGAIRRDEGDVAELKRLWLLEDYHGQGIGYRLVQELLEFARRQGFRSVRLLTDRRQERAVRFYSRVGFQTIPCDSDDPDDVCMAMELT